MPIQETALWQLAAKVAGATIAGMATVGWWLVGKLTKAFDDKVKTIEGEVADLKKIAAAHDRQISVHEAHLKHIAEDSAASRDSIRRLHEKFDAYIASKNS